ncbi:MAG: transcription antitermination factor NusB [Phycisphaerae bacterium]|nr:transcription antitermination factor NusB [Phycisphaerae bacterium]
MIDNTKDDVPSDWRALARSLALQCLTQLDVQGDDFLQDVPAFIADAQVSSEIMTLASDLAHKAWETRKTSDELIGKTVKHWQLQRIALVDRAVLRLAVSELLNRPEVPIKVILDQAIELSKRYSTAESPQFINGVLDAIARSLPEVIELRNPQTRVGATAPEPDDQDWSAKEVQE